MPENAETPFADMFHTAIGMRMPEMSAPLTLEDLKRQVDSAVAIARDPKAMRPVSEPLPEGVLFLIGDFEIRRRRPSYG